MGDTAEVQDLADIEPMGNVAQNSCLDCPGQPMSAENSADNYGL